MVSKARIIFQNFLWNQLILFCKVGARAQTFKNKNKFDLFFRASNPVTTANWELWEVNAQRVSSSRILLTNDFTNLILNMAKSTSSSQQVNEENTDDTTTTGKLFSLKKWNAVAMWSWDVECDTCAIVSTTYPF